MTLLRSCLLGLGFAVSACVTAQVALQPEESARLERGLAGEERFVRVSLYVTPFFGDATRRLVTAVPPEQVRLLENPNASPVNPGKVERIIPAGTAVRITRVEFPTAFVMQERVLYTPRTLVWVSLEVAGTPRNAPPYVLVLRPGLKDSAEFHAEVDRYLSKHDLRSRLESLPDDMREAIATKTARVGMTGEALEMAWGYPERKRIELEGEKRLETWGWADDLRAAKLVDGRVTDLR